MRENKTSLQDEDLLDRAVREAGEIALKFFHSTAKTWDKSDGSPVTEADLKVDDFLKAALLSERENYGWLSEETIDDHQRMSCDRVWIIDPIDGTRAFVNKTDQWCISAALLENGKVTLARVFRPLTGQMYQANATNNAMLNGKVINTTARKTLQGCRMMGRKNILEPSRWGTPWPAMDVDCSTSLALRICMAADGQFDGAISMGKESDWDLAAADLIMRQAGGLITNIYGNEIQYNQENPRQSQGVVAGGSRLHAQMLETTKTYKN